MTLKQSWPGVSGKAQILDIRNALAGAVVRQGVFQSLSDATAVASQVPLMNKTNSMKPTVREFHAAIKRPNRGDGAQLVYNDGPSGTYPEFETAPASGSRKDILWVKAFDTLYDARAGVEFGITKGVSTTGTAQPDRASLPEGALELGTLLLPAGATTLQSTGVVWEDTYAFGLLRGGVLYVRKEADLAAELSNHPLGTPAYAIAEDRSYQLGLLNNNAGARYWLQTGGKPAIGAFSPVSVFQSDASRPVRALRNAGIVNMEGAVRSSSAIFDNTIVYTVGSIPAEFAPKSTKSFSTDVNRVHAYLIFDTNGNIRFLSTVSFNGVLDMTVDVATWADPRTV